MKQSFQTRASKVKDRRFRPKDNTTGKTLKRETFTWIQQDATVVPDSIAYPLSRCSTLSPKYSNI